MRYSGKDGSVWVAYASGHAASYSLLGVTLWSVEEECDEEDATGMDSGGYFEGIGGITKGPVTIEANYDGRQVVEALGFPDPPDIVVGSIIWVKLVQPDTKHFSGYILVTKRPKRVPVKGLVTYSIQGVFTGTYNRPS